MTTERTLNADQFVNIINKLLDRFKNEAYLAAVLFFIIAGIISFYSPERGITYSILILTVPIIFFVFLILYNIARKTPGWSANHLLTVIFLFFVVIVMLVGGVIYISVASTVRDNSQTYYEQIPPSVKERLNKYNTIFKNIVDIEEKKRRSENIDQTDRSLIILTKDYKTLFPETFESDLTLAIQVLDNYSNCGTCLDREIYSQLKEISFNLWANFRCAIVKIKSEGGQRPNFSAGVEKLFEEEALIRRDVLKSSTGKELTDEQRNSWRSICSENAT